jgi:hypothetical protein
MNGILWMLYLADIVTEIKGTADFLAFFSGVGIIAVYIVISVLLDRNNENEMARKPDLIKMLKVLTIVFFISLPLKLFTPSSNTVYAMLGVKATGDVLTEINKSPIAQKAYLLLDHKLDEALKANHVPAPSTEAKSASDAK